MNENEQIQEMARTICGLNTDEGCFCDGGYCNYNCLAYEKAKALYSKGYHKVEHGKWEDNADGTHWCSECGHDATYTYDGIEVCGVCCPFCGADMRKENEGNEM